MSFFKLLYNIFVVGCWTGTFGIYVQLLWCSLFLILFVLFMQVGPEPASCLYFKQAAGRGWQHPEKKSHDLSELATNQKWRFWQRCEQHYKTKHASLGEIPSLSVWVYLTCCLSAMFIDFFYPLPRTYNYLLSGRFPIFTSALRSFIRVFKRLIKSSGESTSKIFPAHPCSLTSW